MERPRGAAEAVRGPKCRVMPFITTSYTSILIVEGFSATLRRSCCAWSTCVCVRVRVRVCDLAADIAVVYLTLPTLVHPFLHHIPSSPIPPLSPYLFPRSMPTFPLGFSPLTCPYPLALLIFLFASPLEAEASWWSTPGTSYIDPISNRVFITSLFL